MRHLVVLLCCVVLLTCGQKRQGSGSSGGSGGGDAGSAFGTGSGSIVACTTDADCPVPAGLTTCATGVCVEKVCSLRAKDSDGDGHAAATCGQSADNVVLGDDCDDAAASTHPSVWDGPGDANHAQSCDGVDQDCSGLADDNTSSAGVTCACETGAPCAAMGWSVDKGNVGECKLGTIRCDAAGVAVCEGAQGPIAANCAADRDFDCNGKADNDASTFIACQDGADGCAGVACPGSSACNAPAKVTAFKDGDGDQYCIKIDPACPSAFDNVGLALRYAASCEPNVSSPPAACAVGDQPCIDARRTQMEQAVIVDCSDSNAAITVQKKYRLDVDQDGTCLFAGAVMACENEIAPNYRLDTACLKNNGAIVDDCNDSNGNLRSGLHTARVDSDSDNYCSGANVQACCDTASGNLCQGASTVYRVGGCSDDCDDSSATYNALHSTRQDADSDGFCTGSAANRCCAVNGASCSEKNGASWRLSGNCAGDDCDDGQAQLAGAYSAREDRDHDGWATGGVLSVCCLPQAGNKCYTLNGARNGWDDIYVTSWLGDDCDGNTNGSFGNPARRFGVDADGDGACLDGTNGRTCTPDAGHPNECNGSSTECRDTNAAEQPHNVTQSTCTSCNTRVSPARCRVCGSQTVCGGTASSCNVGGDCF